MVKAAKAISPVVLAITAVWMAALCSPAYVRGEPSAPAPAPAAIASPNTAVAAGAANGPGEAAHSDDWSAKLRRLSGRVRKLKERVFYVKTRLAQMREVALEGPVVGAKATIVHVNEMGSSFRLVRVQYALDGAPIFSGVDTGGGELDEKDEFEVYSGPVEVGSHQLAVFLEYQGNGFGIFNYLDLYRFKVKSSQTFTAEEAMTTTVRVIGREVGGITIEMKDRPTVQYEVNSVPTPKSPTGDASTLPPKQVQ